MDFIKNAKSAIESDKMIDLLCGKQPYEVEVSRFTSDVLPTDVNAVLVNCVYNLKDEIENTWHHMEDGDRYDII